MKIDLPLSPGQLTSYILSTAPPVKAPPRPFHSRIAFAAAHVVADPAADPSERGKLARLDWEATLAYRRYLWSLGFAVAEAMDTAQRGMGLDWAASQELIRRSLAEAKSVGGRIACGAGTDHLTPEPTCTLADVINAYEQQVGFVEGLGGQVILMASRALAACAQGPDDYAYVYGRVLSQVRQPVIIHWLGEMFDPQLAGYWGGNDPAAGLERAMQSCLQILHAYAAKIDGIKLSLLDAERELAMRRRLPKGMRMYTGDDFNYPELILGDDQGYSDALLGIFDAIAPVAAAAFQALDAGDRARYQALLAPTLPLSRHIFQAPTYHYKTGIVFLAWLNGHQDHFRMVAGQESARSLQHLAQLFVLADQAGLLGDPALALQRMERLLLL
jgi:hypothetical protein